MLAVVNVIKSLLFLLALPAAASAGFVIGVVCGMYRSVMAILHEAKGGVLHAVAAMLFIVPLGMLLCGAVWALKATVFLAELLFDLGEPEGQSTSMPGQCASREG